MTQMVFVVPSEGARVRMPDRNSAVMEHVGAWVPRTVHYERLIASGDVVVASPPPPLPGAAEPETVTPQTSAPQRAKKET